MTKAHIQYLIDREHRYEICVCRCANKSDTYVPTSRPRLNICAIGDIESQLSFLDLLILVI